MTTFDPNITSPIPRTGQPVPSGENQIYALPPARLDCPVLGVDRRGVVEVWNQPLADLTGVRAEEALGNPLPSTFPTRSRLAVVSCLNGTGSRTADLAIFSTRGSHHVLRVTMMEQRDPSGEVQRVIAIGHEVTELTRDHETLKGTAEAETSAHLTAGFVHFFNNVLTVISGNLQLLERRRPHGTDRVRDELIGDASAAAREGAVMLRSLKEFTRTRPLPVQAVVLSAQVRELCMELSDRLGIDIGFECCCDPAAEILANVEQLGYSLEHLCRNGLEAMPNGGDLSVSVHCPPGDDNMAMIAVSDTGEGIDAAHINFVTDPFFTTKPGSGSAGLGLTIVELFARQAQGTLEFESCAEQGTTVRLALPKAPPECNASIERADVAPGENSEIESLGRNLGLKAQG